MSTTDPPTAPAEKVDRRARNRERTRHALTMSALELIADQGFAETSVEEIADHAGVSPRTFFRYFASKDEALMFIDPFESFRDRIMAQPAELSDLEVVHQAFRAMQAEFEPLREQILLLRRALSRSPSLRGRNFDQRADTEHRIADGLATRNGLAAPSGHLVLVSIVAFAVIRHAFDEWLDAPVGTPIGPILDDQFAALSKLVG